MNDVKMNDIKMMDMNDIKSLIQLNLSLLNITDL